MTRPRGTREQIHDLVNELAPFMLDVVLMRVKDAVEMSVRFKEIEMLFQQEKERRSEEATTTI